MLVQSYPKSLILKVIKSKKLEFKDKFCVKIMNNKDLKDLILATTIQTGALVTLWGLTNYMNQTHDINETIMYHSKLFGYNIKITGRIFYGVSFLSSYIVLSSNLYNLIK